MAGQVNLLKTSKELYLNNNQGEGDSYSEFWPTNANKKPNLLKKKPILSTLDILISIFIVSPCVVGFWRAVWELAGVYKEYFPSMEIFILTTLIHFVFCLNQDLLNELMEHPTGDPSLLRSIFDFFVIRLYILFLGVVNILNWKTAWEVLDEYFEVQLTPINEHVLKVGSGPMIFATFLCMIALIPLKCVNNVCASPFVIYLDGKEKFFTVSTRYQQMSERTSLYILDCLFSVLVVGTLVVFVWRGAWALIDIYFFPEDEYLSAWASLIVGYAAVAVAFLLQPIMKWICDRITGAARLLVADLFLLFSLVGTVNVWRGIWNLLNLYFLPDDIELSCWITHWVCLGILVLLGCSNSLLVRGVYIDAEEPGGKCVVFPCYYLRLIFHDQKLKLSTEFGAKGKITELVHVKPLDINNHVIVNVPSEKSPEKSEVPNHHHFKEET